MKRLLSFLLLASMLLCTACGGTSASADTTAAPDSGTAAPDETTYADDLPEGLDFGGETVTFLYRSEIADEFHTEDQNGEVVNDAVYDSFRAVEERLNVKINNIDRAGHLTENREEFRGHVRATVMAGDDVYDWVDLMVGNATTLALEGLFINLLDNPYINYDQPWYIPGMVDTCALYDKLYFVAGDISLGYLKTAFCLYYNRKLCDDYGIGNLYDVVDSGKWTIDKMAEVAAKACRDVNGDGIYDLNDKLGYVDHDTNYANGFVASTGTEMCTKNAAGEWEFTYGTEKHADVLMKLMKLYTETDGVYKFDGTNARTDKLDGFGELSGMFMSGDVLMISAELDNIIAEYRDMKDPYGILPYPKADENQESYITTSRNTHNAFVMPKTTSRYEAASAVMEALSAEKYNRVFPAYFEVAMKVKYSDDSDTARMFDLVHDSMILDFTYVYNTKLNYPYSSCFVGLITKADTFASTVASKKSTFQTNLKNYMTEFYNMNCKE